MLPVFTLLLVLSLSDERAVAPLKDQPASATNAAVATNGRNQLVAWKAASHEAVYLQTLDDSFALRAPNGVLLGRPETGSVALGGAASDGDGYLVVWNDERKVWATHVNTAGEIATPRLIAESTAKTSFARVASNGRGYLAIWNESTSTTARVFGRMLDAAGAPLGDAFPVTDPMASVLDSHLASDGTAYMSAIHYYERRGNSLSLHTQLVPVSAAGVAGTAHQTAPYLEGLLFDGTTYLVIHWTARSTYVFLAAPVDSAGNIGSAREVASVPTGTLHLAAFASNGNGSIVVPYVSGVGPRVVRLAPGGVPMDAVPRSMPLPSLSGVAIGAAPGGQYFVAGLSPLAGARMIAFLDVAPPGGLQPLANAPVPQRRPRVVPVAGGQVVTYHEGYKVLANGAEVTNDAITSTLASDGTRGLVAWTNHTDTTAFVHGRYVEASGRMSAPFVIAQGGELFELTDAMAVDGGIVVVWQGNESLFRARAGSNDAPIAFNLPTYAGATTKHREGAMARTADGFLLVYTEIVNTRDAIRAVPFRADLGFNGSMKTIADTIDAESNPDVASDGAGRVLAVWSAIPRNGTPAEVRAVLLAEDGSAVGEELVLGTGTMPRVSWTGASFAIVSGSKLAAVSRDGEVLQPLTPMLGLVENPGLDGRVLAYTKEEQVRVRTIGDVRRRPR